MAFCYLEGPPCLRHNNYVFYKAFKYKCDDRYRILCLGDFFFIKILSEFPVCIGEVELIWEDSASGQCLASVRLYCRPEYTPEGRLQDMGEDEIVALGDRLVLRLEDLVPLIQHNIKWTYGRATCRKNKVIGPTSDNRSSTGVHMNKNGVVSKDGHGRNKKTTGSLGPDSLKKEDVADDDCSSGAANLAVMSYPKYCRYRAVQRRLEGFNSEWLELAVVVAIGGFSGKQPGCRVMFCRDTFFQPELDDLEIRMDHMLPVLKCRAKGKKGKPIMRKDSQQDSDSLDEMFANVTPSISSSSRPRRSTETSDISEDKVSTEEQAFLIGLHKFMHDSQMSIGRIPSLGFKQIDLFYFYKQADNLGGYDAITHNRQWKLLYDKLGGHSSNTSAATCTRKHYERLLLPYELHLRKLPPYPIKEEDEEEEEDSSNQIEAESEVQDEIIKTGGDIIKTDDDIIKPNGDIIKIGDDVTKTGCDIIQTGDDIIKTGSDIIKAETKQEPNSEAENGDLPKSKDAEIEMKVNGTKPDSPEACGEESPESISQLESPVIENSDAKPGASSEMLPQNKDMPETLVPRENYLEKPVPRENHFETLVPRESRLEAFLPRQVQHSQPNQLQQPVESRQSDGSSPLQLSHYHVTPKPDKVSVVQARQTSRPESQELEAFTVKPQLLNQSNSPPLVPSENQVSHQPLSQTIKPVSSFDAEQSLMSQSMKCHPSTEQSLMSQSMKCHPSTEQLLMSQSMKCHPSTEQPLMSQSMKCHSSTEQSLSLQAAVTAALPNKGSVTSATPTTATPPAPIASGLFPMGEDLVSQYAGMMYKDGYLIPVLPHHLLNTPWPLMPPVSSPLAASSFKRDSEAVKASSVEIQEPVLSVPSSKLNQYSSSLDHGNKSSDKTFGHFSAYYSPASASMSLTSSSLSSSALSSLASSSGANTKKAAVHISTPYKAAPYFPSEQKQSIYPASQPTYPGSQPTYSASQPTYSASQNLTANDRLGASLIAALHPAPPGHRTKSHLPPAPTSVYLHPADIHPLVSLHASMLPTPPQAHSHLRKRVYPFDSPDAVPTSGLFPSPDTVWDRIRNCAGFPGSNSVLARPAKEPQRFEDPRQILQQTSPTNSLNVHSSQRREGGRGQQDRPSTKPSHSRPKNSKKSQASNHQSSGDSKANAGQHGRATSVQLPKGAGHGELRLSQTSRVVDHHKHGDLRLPQTSRMVDQQKHGELRLPQTSRGMDQHKHGELRLPQTSRVVDQHKQASHVNGLQPVHQSHNAAGSHLPHNAPGSHLPASGVPSSSQAGRLTSALFGTQFTALPRATKPADVLPPAQSQLMLSEPSSAAVAAMTLSQHPAFMSPYLPAGSPAAATVMNPQLQMLAFEEMLRQSYLMAAAHDKKKN